MTETSDEYGDLPVLETARLRLRPIRRDDAGAMFEYASDPLVTQYLQWRTHESLEDTHDYITALLDRQEHPDLAPWGIEHRQDGRLIGSCDFHNWNLEHARAELGYVLAREYWRQGYMTEAVRAVVACGFDTMSLNRIEALCRLPNVASARVLEKAGMRFEGVLRQYLFAHGVYHDYKIYALLREEYSTDVTG
ncbi:MAG TPA: GNAT family N-acetyltransferase [Abditibacteriaceae bacterium]|nr:GNAT family N-acetyltransferase [Abditibacteriaceae bacterium]